MAAFPGRKGSKGECLLMEKSKVAKPSVGLEGAYSMTVEDRHLAPAEEGDPRVQVLSTPYVVWLMERAVTDAIRDHDNPDEVSLGTRVEVDHLAPTPSGHRVTARAVLTEVNGPRLAFEIEVHDEKGLAARGKLWRFQLPVDRFRKKLRGREA